MGKNTPFKAPFKVLGTGCSFAIVDAGGTQIGRVNGKRDDAEFAMERIEQEARIKRRACLTCEAPFLSEGPHNRMCKEFRRLSQPVAL